MRGEDPLTTNSPENLYTHPSIEVFRRMFHVKQMKDRVDQVLAGPEWKQVSDWYRNVEKQYEEHNKSLLEVRKPNMSPEELLDLQKRLQPLEVDPNEAASMRQLMTKVNQQIQQASGGSVNLWNYPGTRRIATYMNREAAIGIPGFFRSGDQPLPATTEYLVRPFLAGLEVPVDWGFQAVMGARSWTAEAINAITGSQLNWETPRSFVETEDGRVLSDEGRVMGGLDMFVAMRAKVMGDDVGKAVASWNAAQEHSEANANGLGQVLTGASQVAGMILTFAPTAQLGTKLAGGMTKGAQYLGALGKVGKGMQSTRRARAVLHAIQGTGQAMAFGLNDVVLSGKPEKATEALSNGLKTGYLMYALGAMGRGVEHFAKTRVGMPTKVAQGLGLMTEAAGFTALEFGDLQGSLWEFIKDPREHTWEEYGKVFSKNFLGMLLARGMGLRIGDKPRPAYLKQAARSARTVVGEQFRTLKGQGKAPPAEMRREVEAMGARPEQLERLGELTERARKGDVEAQVERAKLEKQLDVQEAGVGRAETEDIRMEVERVGKAPAPKLEEPGVEMRMLARRGPTPETVARVGELLRGARGRYLQQAVRTIATERRRAMSPQEREKAPVGELAKVERAEGEGILGSFAQEYRARRAEGVSEGPIVRKSDIWARMEGFEGDPIRTPQRKGRISGRGLGRSTKGFLARNENLIRYRGETEWAERAHEFSHAVQEAAVGLKGHKLPRAALVEADKMLEGYGGKEKLTQEQIFNESWAEYHARDLLGEEGLAQKFPELTKIFAPMLASRPGVMNQYAEVKALSERHWELTSFAKGRSFIHAIGDIPSPQAQAKLKTEQGGALRRGVRKMNEWFWQDVERLNWSVQRWSKIAGIDPSTIPIQMHILRSIETLRYTESAKVASFMEEGVLRVRGGKLERGQSLKDAFKTIDTPEKKESAMVFLVARKMWEMNKKGLQTGFSRPEILRMLDTAAAKFGGLVKAEALARKVKSFWDDIVGWAADEGMMPRETADELIATWQTYVPFQRYYSEALKAGLGKGGGLRRLKGGIEEVADPFEAMTQVALGVVRQVHRHKALDSLYEMGREFKGVGGLVFELKPSEVPKEFTVAEVLKAIEQQIKLPGDVQMELEWNLDVLRNILGPDVATSLMLFRPEYQAHRNRPILLHRTRDGRRVHLEVDKTAFEAIQSVENPEVASRAAATLQSISRFPLVRMPTSLVKFFATGVNLEFAVRNMFRDAALFSGYSKVPRSMLPWSGIYYWMRGVKRVLNMGKDPQIAEINSILRAQGAEGLTYFAREIKRQRGSQKLLPKAARVHERWTPRGMLNKTRDVIEGSLGKLVDIGERALRADEFHEVYKARMAAGKSHSEAALDALEASKEVTINFTRAGMISRELNAIVPYFNASMQGMRKTFRAFSGADGDKAMKASWINLASTLGTLTALEHWFHGDEDWHQDLQPWQRYVNWNFNIGGEDFAIPKPHLPAYVVTTFFDQLFSKNKMDVKDVLGEARDQLIWDHLALPSAILPFIEWRSNYSFWRARQLVPDWLEQSRIGPDQYRSYTAGWAKWVSRTAYDTFGVDFSPIKLENMLNQSTGSLPSQLERYIGGLGNMMGFQLDPERSDTRDQVPILNAFLKHHAHKGSLAVNRFYEIRRELKKLKGSRQLKGIQTTFFKEAEQLEDRLNSVRILEERGIINRERRDRLSYELAKPFVTRYRKAAQ